MKKTKLLIEIISYVIERGHFDPKNIDNEFSENMFKEFIENTMDGQHRFSLALILAILKNINMIWMIKL